MAMSIMDKIILLYGRAEYKDLFQSFHFETTPEEKLRIDCSDPSKYTALINLPETNGLRVNKVSLTIDCDPSKYTEFIELLEANGLQVNKISLTIE